MSGGEQVLSEDWCQQYPSHSIGALAFGPDGALYVSGGDGASFNNADWGQFGQPKNPCGDPPVPVGGTQSAPSAQGGALRSQDIRTMLDPVGLDGSVLRVDPNTGAGLPDNPLAGSLDPNARRIVATGLRNPFRMALRPGSPQVYVGDVGWSSWEEINRIDNPTDGSVDNFGWPCYEGGGRQGGYDAPDLALCEDLYDDQPPSTKQGMYAYGHGAPVVSGESCTTGNGSSTAGLAFYEGGDYPAGYDGALFFADYSRKCIWAMFEQGGVPDPATRQTFARAVDPVNLKIGPGGDLFMVDFTGSISRFTYQSTNRPPTAVAQASPTSGPVPLTVNFDARSSTDPDSGDVLTYAWDLDGDGIYDESTSAQPSWTYTSEQQVTVGLRAIDSRGELDTDSVVIGPGQGAPVATIAAPAATLNWAVGERIEFRGSATDPQEGPLAASRLSWELILQHCTTATACHSHPIETWPGVAQGFFDAPDHPYPSHLELKLTATDSTGQSDTETVRLDPRTVDLTFRTQPLGLKLAVGSAEEVTPFTRRVIVGSTNSVSAASPQALGSQSYIFSSWSHGGSRSHDIVAGSAPATFTATYEADPTPVGLVAGFGFNESSGVSAADVSPEGNTGVVSGAAWLPAGRFGGALSFDGVNDWVTVADDASLDLTGPLTLEAWVRPSTIADWRTVALKEHPPGAHAYALYASDGARPLGEVFTTNFRNASGPPLATNTWTHLATTYSDNTVRLYINGNLAGSNTVTGNLPTTNGPLRIGGNAVWGEYFAGQIDELRLYRRALTATEIQTDMNTPVVADRGPPSAPGNLVANGGLGQVALDWDTSSDDLGVTAYHVHRGGAAGFTPSASNRIAVVSSGTDYIDRGLAAGDYFYRVTAVDGAGNVSPASNEARGTAAADSEPPTVALTAPAAGARVSGTIDVRATASDNGSVAGVQFLLDGQPLGAEDTASPYEHSWDTKTVANGSHQLAARARDSAGNQRTSTTVTVTVDNALDTGLVAGFGFNESSGVSAADVSPEGNTGVVSGAAWLPAGRFGGALSFDGVNDWVTVADDASLDLTGPLTLEAWVRPSTIADWRTVALKEHPPGAHAYALYASDGARPLGEVFTTNFRNASGPPLATNTWTHLATTYSDNTVRLYINGNLAGSNTVTGNLPTTNGPLRIGGNAVWGEYFAGQIDELRLYRRALTATEIQTDMNTPVVADRGPPSAPGNLVANGGLGQVALDWDTSSDDLGVTAYHVHRGGAAGFTPSASNRIAVVSSGTDYIDRGLAAGDYFYRVTAVDGAGNVSPASNEARGTAAADSEPPTVALTAPAAGARVSGTIDVRATASDNGSVAGVQFLLDGQPLGAEDTASPYEHSWDTKTVANGSHQLAARARDSAGNQRTSTTVTVTVDNALDTGLVAGFGFNESSGVSAADVSPEGNTGVVSGAAWLPAGRFGGALSFDGVNDWVTVADDASLDLTGPLTLEAWVRPSTIADWRTVALKEHPPGAHAYALYASDGARPLGEVFTTNFRNASGPPLATNTWTHLATTYSDNTVRLYINGNLAGSNTVTGNLPTTNGPLRIGGNAVWGEYFAGQIDELRLYRRALTATEIQTDMNTPVGP